MGGRERLNSGPLSLSAPPPFLNVCIMRRSCDIMTFSRKTMFEDLLQRYLLSLSHKVEIFDLKDEVLFDI
jgi:hypothetical protein